MLPRDTWTLGVLGAAMLLTTGSKAPGEAPPLKPRFFSGSRKIRFLYPDTKYLRWGAQLQKYKKGQKNFQGAYIGRRTYFWPFEPHLLFVLISCLSWPQFLTKSFVWYPSKNKFHTQNMVLLFTCSFWVFFFPCRMLLEKPLLFKCETTLLPLYHTSFNRVTKFIIHILKAFLAKEISSPEVFVFRWSTGQTDTNCTLWSQDLGALSEVSSKSPA